MPHRATLSVRSKRGAVPRLPSSPILWNLIFGPHKSSFVTLLALGPALAVFALSLVTGTIDQNHRYDWRKNSRSPFVKSTDAHLG